MGRGLRAKEGKGQGQNLSFNGRNQGAIEGQLEGEIRRTNGKGRVRSHRGKKKPKFFSSAHRPEP